MGTSVYVYIHTYTIVEVDHYAVPAIQCGHVAERCEKWGTELAGFLNYRAMAPHLGRALRETVQAAICHRTFS